MNILDKAMMFSSCFEFVGAVVMNSREGWKKLESKIREQDFQHGSANLLHGCLTDLNSAKLRSE